eukprot:251036_1
MATNTPTPGFRGFINICLWFRENPFSMQESGPPIPDYFLEVTGNSEVLGNGYYTGEDGCISMPFESSWPGESLSIGLNMHNGGLSTYVYASESYQTVDFESLSMDSLPEAHFQQKFDCSTCDVYYADNNMYEEPIATSSLGAASPLTEHLCSSTNSKWGLNCCGYDW